MTSSKFTLTLLLSAIFAGSTAATAVADIVIPTNKSGGADAEIREFQQNNRFGASTELASRARNGVPAATEAINPALGTADRSSIMMLRFNIRGITPAQVADATSVSLRTTWRNNNLAQSQETATNNTNGRIIEWEDPSTGVPDPNGNNVHGNDVSKEDDNGDEFFHHMGFNYYALNPGHPANNSGTTWLESGPADNNGVIRFNNAPGVIDAFPGDPARSGDGDVGTFDPDPTQTVFLGNKKLPNIGTQNHLRVGEAFLFDIPSLQSHLADAVAAGDDYVNIMITLDWNGDINFTQLTNFNYLVNPKEQTTLQVNTNWLEDVTTDPDTPGTPISGNPGAPNPAATGPFSPTLILAGVVPEPTSLALVSLGALSGLSMLRRRRA